MTKPEDFADCELLMAYADGELDQERAAEVERRLAVDDVARQLVAAFMQHPAKLKAAFGHEALGRIPAAPVEPMPAPTPANENRASWRSPFVAASVGLTLIVTGALAGWGSAELHWRMREADRVAAIDAASEAQQMALNAALERNSNGEANSWAVADGAAEGTITPTLTFVNEEGAFCREIEQQFTVDGLEQTSHGVACRVGEGQWQVRYWLLKNPSALPGVTL